jgi:hypothetical protein
MKKLEGKVALVTDGTFKFKLPHKKKRLKCYFTLPCYEQSRKSSTTPAAFRS